MIKLLENVLFSAKAIILAVFAVITIYCAYYAFQLRMDAGFEKQLPTGHEYIQTFQDYRDRLFGSNRVIIVLAQREGTIWNKDFFKTYKEVTDELFYLPGVDRRTVTSLWTPNTRYLEITEEGINADDVIPGTVTVSNMDDAALARIENNVIRGNFLGRLVAEDSTAAMVVAELLDIDPQTQQRLDYFDLADQLEDKIRGKYEDDNYTIHIIGFAKLIGDIADGAQTVVFFFILALALTVLSVYLYAQSWALTGLAIFCSLTSLVWQFGVLHILGFGLDPLAILVPFLVFAIGVSHGVQQINLITKEVTAGSNGEEAARASFRLLFIPGSMALITDLVGFGTLILIPIGMIQELAITASIGVALKIVTNLVMLPLLASYFSFDEKFVDRANGARDFRLRVMGQVGKLAEPRVAVVIFAGSIVLFGLAFWQSLGRHVGDLHAGAPELRPDARYNEDSRFVVEKFALGLNLLTVVNETPSEACIDHNVMSYLARFSWYMQNREGVAAVISLPTAAKGSSAGWNEGNLKYQTLPRNKFALVQAVGPVPTSSGLLDVDCTTLPLQIFTDDSKATTIESVIAGVKTWRQANPYVDPDGNVFVDQWGNRYKTEDDVRAAVIERLEADAEKAAADGGEGASASRADPEDYYRNIVNVRLASGNVGVQAATNEEIETSELPMMLYVYATIILLVYLTYRDWRATICCCVPLTLATFLGYWFMKELEIGLKVATLPVMVLAVGLGVDYAFYIYNRLQFHLAEGLNITDSFKQSMFETGMAVVFTAITLAVGVSTWTFSPLKFQADMGLLLTFMFMTNMIMSITVLPAIAVVLDMVFPRRTPVKAASGMLAH